MVIRQLVYFTVHMHACIYYVCIYVARLNLYETTSNSVLLGHFNLAVATYSKMHDIFAKDARIVLFFFKSWDHIVDNLNKFSTNLLIEQSVDSQHVYITKCIIPVLIEMLNCKLLICLNCNTENSFRP